MVFDGVAHDVTAWLAVHPGGPKVLLDAAASGVDASEAFDAVLHSPEARRLLSSMRVARLSSSV